MMLEGKMALDGKNIAVLTGERVDDYAVEIGEIIRAMKEMGARVRVVSSAKKRLGRGLAGAVRVDIAIDKVKAGDFDAIVLGTNCRNSNAREHLFCIRFLNEAYEQGKLVAAIGKGLEPVLLAQLLPEASLLRALAAYSYDSGTGTSLTDRLIVNEDNLIIAGDLMKMMSFVKRIANALGEDSAVKDRHPMVGM